MTPTLRGRWQSRLFLMGTIGLIVTLFFVIAFRSMAPLTLLGLVIVLGFGWDILYTLIQKWRWDHDWPPAFQLGAGIWEMIALAAVIYGARLIGNPPNPAQFLFHYSAVWLAVFIGSQSLMRLIFPRWRYNGGQWIQKL